MSDIVYAEGLVGNIYLERPADLERYRTIAHAVDNMAHYQPVQFDSALIPAPMNISASSSSAKAPGSGPDVFVEGLFSNRYQERPIKIDPYHAALEYLREAALSSPDSTSPITPIRSTQTQYESEMKGVCTVLLFLAIISAAGTALAAVSALISALVALDILPSHRGKHRKQGRRRLGRRP